MPELVQVDVTVADIEEARRRAKDQAYQPPRDCPIGCALQRLGKHQGRAGFSRATWFEPAYDVYKSAALPQVAWTFVEAWDRLPHPKDGPIDPVSFTLEVS